MRLDDDGHQLLVLRLLLLAAVTHYACGENAHPTNEHTTYDKQKRHEANILAALRRIREAGWIRSSLALSAHLYFMLSVGCTGRGVG